MIKVFYMWPHTVYLMLALPLFLFLYWKLQRERKKALESFSKSALHNNILHRRARLYTVIKIVLLLLSWMMLTIALMQPIVWYYPDEEKVPLLEKILEWDFDGLSTSVRSKQVQAHEVVVVIDTSASMSVKDAPGGKTRLEYARELSDALIGELNGQMVSLYAFTSELTPLVPATLDYLFTRLILRDVKINEGDVSGTDFQTLLERLRKKYWANESNRLVTLFMISDGDDTAFSKNEVDYQSLKALVDGGEHLRVVTVGVGSDLGAVIPEVTYQGGTVTSSLNEKLLQSIAMENFYFSSSGTDPQNLMKRIVNVIRRVGKPTEETLASEKPFREIQLFYLPLILAIIFLGLSIVLPETEPFPLA